MFTFVFWAVAPLNSIVGSVFAVRVASYHRAGAAAANVSDHRSLVLLKRPRHGSQIRADKVRNRARVFRGDARVDVLAVSGTLTGNLCSGGAEGRGRHA